jgi:hypothetical protein
MVTSGAFALQSSCELTRTLGLARGGISDDHTRGIVADAKALAICDHSFP